MLHSELPFDLRVREQEQHSRQGSLLTETSERKRNGEKVLGQRPTHLLDAGSLHRRPQALACLLISQLEKFHSECDLLARQKPASRQRAVQTAECVSPFLPHTGARSPSDNKICISIAYRICIRTRIFLFIGPGCAAVWRHVMLFASLAAPSTYMHHPQADETSQPSKTAQAPPRPPFHSPTWTGRGPSWAECGGIGGARRGITWSRSKGLKVILTAWNAEAKLTTALSTHRTINTPEKGFLSVWPRTQLLADVFTSATNM